ncbi:hypothetical protein NP493_803g00018 [Ridgeia piscesae]|uniref:RING-type domain-containing protein n=1 Tax=Ridgeia piscesae TaxID=27915 RepID=A0AAD9KNK4_RIDPI|nr:hypothetical protein NP493_803g00018 [Ridgeia piscesae]
MAELTDFIRRELDKVKTKYKEIDGVELISCVPALVQLKIVQTTKKEIVTCFLFPEDYPRNPILIELKSKYLAYKLLDGLRKVCEEETKKLIGQQQILPIVQFVKNFIVDNPLCVCSEEISNIKKRVLQENDEIRLKQKTSQVVIKLKQDAYYLNARLTVPNDYPLERTGVEITYHNFPESLKRHFLSQVEEIARKCVQPPLKKKPKDPPFEPKPALQPIVEYLVKDIVRKYPSEICPVCNKPVLPSDPKDVVKDPCSDKFVDRLYCCHLFHRGCLDAYMKKPPFTGGKKCPKCGCLVFHENWKLTPELSEARWAHQEARRRELAEVVDFLQ